MKKTFSPSLHSSYDDVARNATKQFLERRGYMCKDNPDKYGQDILYVDSKGRERFAECEIKTLWKGDTFPFDSVQLPTRKRKFFKKPTLFFIWNANTTKAALFWSHDVQDLVPVEVPNKYLRKGEKFFQIPLNKVTFAKK